MSDLSDKSSKMGGSRMPVSEVPWRRSSRCENVTCVEVGFVPDAVLIRDGKDRAGPIIRIDRPAWREFITALNDGALRQA